MSVLGGDSQIFFFVSLITEVFVDNMPTTRTFNVVDVVVVVVIVAAVVVVVDPVGVSGGGEGAWLQLRRLRPLVVFVVAVATDGSYDAHLLRVGQPYSQQIIQ